MSKVEKIIQKYTQILIKYQQKYNIHKTILGNFTEFNNLFITIIQKELEGLPITIDKRDEYDVLNGILTQITVEYDKLTARKFEIKMEELFSHRDKFIKLLHKHNFKLPKEEKPVDPLVIKPDYGL